MPNRSLYSGHLVSIKSYGVSHRPLVCTQEGDKGRQWDPHGNPSIVLPSLETIILILSSPLQILSRMAPMASQDTLDLPSLLVFGPQTNLPPDETLTPLRQELLHHPDLAPLRETLHEIVEFWKALTAFDPSLGSIPGSTSLTELQRWVEEGGVFPHRSPNSLSICTIPATFLLQIAQYTRYLTCLERLHPHEAVREALQVGGVQGSRIGLLSAVTVSTADTLAEIGSIAAANLRLAVCIGAYVDLHARSAREANQNACISVRWPSTHQGGRQKVQRLISAFPNVCTLIASSQLLLYPVPG